MNPAVQAEQKLDQAPLDFRLALTFSPAEERPALTALMAVYLEILDLLQESVMDQIFRIALRHAHPAPDLRYQQAHVVIHANVGADAHR